ncbi:MAG: asparaginase domain-containing protein [Patescibacteria group bacterium]|nr:asparaginase domain-containing protein [Patescibacteria group bacterium]
MKITFIQTGGTIDKEYPKTTKGYAFEIGEPAVKRILEKINPVFEYEIIPLLQKDSLDITEKDREKITLACKNNQNDKIVITHGTDTMAETAEKLSEIKDKTIVITGAMRPEKFYDSDAMFNVGAAIISAANLPRGVYITMNGRVYEWNKVKRDIVTGQFIEA